MAITGQNVYGMSGTNVAEWITNNSPFYAEFINSMTMYLYTDSDKTKLLATFTLHTFAVTLYYNNGASTVNVSSSSSVSISSMYVYLCSNGIIIDKRGATSRQFTPIMITKNSDGECAYLYSSDTTANSDVVYYTNLHSLSYSAATIADFSYTPVNLESTSLTNVCYHGEIGRNNSMEFGFISLFYQYNSFGILTLDDEQYISNGYWCIKD